MVCERRFGDYLPDSPQMRTMRPAADAPVMASREAGAEISLGGAPHREGRSEASEGEIT